MKWKVIAAALALAIGLGAASWAVIRNSSAGDAMRKADRWSAIVSLEDQVVAHLEDYRKVHGGYPERIDPTAIDFEKTDEATPEMLSSFVYAKVGNTYELRIERTP